MAKKKTPSAKVESMRHKDTRKKIPAEELPDSVADDESAPQTVLYGQRTVLTPRMNPDLAMGDEFLKKTGAGNLFIVFGEPDLDIQKRQDRSSTTTATKR